MGENALVVIAKKFTKKFCAPVTKKGRVRRLDDFVNSLTTNAEEIAKRYLQLKKIEAKISVVLKNIKAEEYTVEFEEIDSLTALSKEERQTFKDNLLEIKRKAIEDLEPITVSAQKIKAHMLITMNKATTRKTILVTKSNLASNAYLQLDTINLIDSETENINKELVKLIAQLDAHNEKAIGAFKEYEGEQKEITGGKSVMSHIMSKANPKEDKVVDEKNKGKEEEEKTE